MGARHSHPARNPALTQRGFLFGLARMSTMTTARLMLKQLLDEIQAGPFNVAQVCREAKMDPSVVSRWKKYDIEPRLSTLERLEDAHNRLKARAKK